MSSSKRSLHKYYELLRTNGIDVVALDFRNHGLSGLDLPISSGYVERIDIIDTIKWMKDKWEQYVIVATSMGSYATLYALNDIEPDDYPEMISIGSFGLDPLTGIASFLHYKLKVPSLLSEFLVRIIKILKPEYFSRDILNQISALDLPIVISHGVYDRIYPPTRIHPSIARLEKEGLKLYRANTEHSEVWKEPKFQDLLIDAILQSFT